MANVSHSAVVEAFKQRYDFQSAETMLKDVLKSSGLGQKDAYSDGDIAKIGETLGSWGERGYEVILDALQGDGGGKAEAKPAAKEEAKEEAKKDDKKDEKKDDKKDEKKDDKKDDKKAAADDKKEAADDKKGGGKKKK